ncbi:MAG: carboxypeptidase regulatory-like domain-containing protein [Terracidiphilus sp.]
MTFKLRPLGPLALLLSVLLVQMAAAQSAALAGTVLDPSAAAIPGAQIALAGAGQTLHAKSGADGRYAFRALAPGVYALSVTAKGFAPLTIRDVAIVAGQTKELNLPLSIAVEQQNVTVAGENQGVGINSDQNANATIIRGSALNALSDDPNELSEELQALAGPAAGPSGGEIYIDGFAGGRLPPKSSILEIRVNQNPFSAEFDRIGYGRLEIITKPGSEKFQGSVSSGGASSGINTANPLVSDQPSYYQYTIVGNVAGPLSKNASYFFSGFRIIRQNQAMVDAINPEDTSASIHQAVPTPITYLSINPRFDFQLGSRNTATIRDSFYRTNQTGVGVGALSLSSQASSVISEENALQLGDTFLVNAHFVNETHFQWSRIYNDVVPQSPLPAVTVQGAFSSGGSSGGAERDMQNNFELQNYSTAVSGAHTLRFGTRLRLYDDTSYTNSGQNGTYTFDSIANYQANQPDQYSANVVYHPQVNVLLFDGAFFFQDDWRWKPNFMMSAGLRLEGQNRIHDRLDWAPRLAVAWSPKHSGTAPAKTVIRAGYGWFYNRFTVPNSFSADSGTPYVDEVIHNNLINAVGYVVASPNAVFPDNQFNSTAPASIPPSLLASAAASVPTYQSIDPHFHAALDMQTGVGVDRQITARITANLTYLYTQGVHQYLMNNVNAPAFDLATYTPASPTPPMYNYQFQSGGFYRQSQLIFTASARLKQININATYLLNQARSDTQDATYVPSVAQDPGLDYGRASFGYRQRFVLLDSYTGPFGIVFGSLLIAQSGTPYNITIGSDLTENRQFNARPTYGQCGAAGVVTTQYGCLDTNPAGKGERVIPYGIGTGPANVVYHVRISKVIGVGPRIKTAAESATYSANGNSVSGRGLSGGSAGVQLNETAPRRYNLTFVASAANLFNDVNLGAPNGVLLSPLFNKSQSLAVGPFANPTPGNRAISFQADFTF